MTTLTKNTFQSFTLPLVDHSPRGNEGNRTSDGGRATLGHRLELTWEALRAAGVAACPLCGSRMERRAAHARCGCCGTRLS
ncbi:MAG TPA: hypothetical protein VF712_02760 [Thermoleophilaceae bacterium]|jgi:hypothetical protein